MKEQSSEHQSVFVGGGESTREHFDVVNEHFLGSLNTNMKFAKRNLGNKLALTGAGKQEILEGRVKKIFRRRRLKDHSKSTPVITLLAFLLYNYFCVPIDTPFKENLFFLINFNYLLIKLKFVSKQVI